MLLYCSTCFSSCSFWQATLFTAITARIPSVCANWAALCCCQSSFGSFLGSKLELLLLLFFFCAYLFLPHSKVVGYRYAVLYCSCCCRMQWLTYMYFISSFTLPLPLPSPPLPFRSIPRWPWRAFGCTTASPAVCCRPAHGRQGDKACCRPLGYEWAQ